MTTTTNATPTVTHYRLTIESVAHTVRDDATGQAETVLTTDLIAVNNETGERFAYCGPAPCSTQGEALELMARIYAWERKGDHRLDPTARGDCWAAERAPAGDLPGGLPGGLPGHRAWPTEVAVSVPVKPGVVKVAGRRARKVDAGKVRRLKGCAVG